MVDRCKLNTNGPVIRLKLNESNDNIYSWVTTNNRVDHYYLPLVVFDLVKFEDYIAFLEAIKNETYFQVIETGGFHFGPLEGSPFDGIEALPSDEVEISINLEVIRISRIEFLKYASEFGHKILEGVIWFNLAKTGKVNQVWINKVIEIVKEIDNKIIKK